mmetsp:Transcript_21508/g.28233  ORF Transcript_21508/g.28233 Transcript_21508/m.28233 type:complete len:633 (-) Transcript_21508:263-2161(-)
MAVDNDKSTNKETSPLENGTSNVVQEKKKRSWFPSTSMIATIIIFGYLSLSFRQFYYVMNPMALIEVDDSEPTVDPLWKEGTLFGVRCYLSQSRENFANKKSFNVTGTKSAPLLLQEDGLRYETTALDVTRTINLTEPSSFESESQEAESCERPPEGEVTPQALSTKLWNRAVGNRTLFLHVIVTQEGYSPDPKDEHYDPDKTMYGTVPLVKLGPHPQKRETRYLMNDVWRKLGWDWLIKDGSNGKKQAKPVPKGTPVPLWKPEIAIKLVNDFTRYPQNQLPQSILQSLTIVQHKGGFKYKPPMHVDEMGLTSDRYIVLNETVEHLPLEISIAPMSVQRWLLMQNLEFGLRQQVEVFGFSETDVDDVRNLVSNTNIYLLGITIFASTLHLLFEFLAFKSDVNFWRKNKSLRGLSARSVIIDFFSQIVIFFYLVDVDTSLLVTIPAFIGILIQVWKVKRATGVTLLFKGIFPTVVFARLQAEEQGKENKQKDTATNTMHLDKTAIKSMTFLLLPLAIGFSLKSLIFDQHPGWYSWAVASLTGCVYTFGFVLMTPQLYINYKLKSVAHLPWRFLAYRFVNTFIDDLFAFIIKMPTMHRVSCFRDDVVFLIYLYQRRIYPVDKSRAIAVEDTAGN